MMNKSQGLGEKKKPSQLPGWLWPNSSSLPQTYKQVWEAVRDDKNKPSASLQREVLVDTNKVFPLLLTSQLPTEILGYIWSLANQKYSGQLTEQELYIILALVALAQASYPFNSLDVLHLVRVPPIPTLNLGLINNNSQMKLSSLQKELHTFQESKKQTDPKQSYDNECYKDCMSTALNDVRVITKSNGDCHKSSVDSSDEFSDFQSAPLPSVPNISILDSKQGSTIGSRLANHNLASKRMYDKIKKSSIFKSQNSNNILVKNSEGAVINTTNHVENTEKLSDLFPKCSIKSQSKTVILKDTVIRSDETIKSTNPIVKDFNYENDRDLEFGNFVQAESLQNKCDSSNYLDTVYQDLMSLQPVEDKYSALRALENSSCSSHTVKLNTNANESQVNLGLVDESPVLDDFGDFVSAENTENCAPESDYLKVDLLADLDFNNYKINKSDPSLMQEISEAFNALGIDTISHQNLSDDKFDSTYEDDTVTKEDTISLNSIDIGNNLSENLPRSASVPSLDLKSFLVSSQEDDQSGENMHQMIYSEWKLYMESCVLLLQLAANIFTAIKSETVLSEVLSSARGYNFLCNLAEVAAICRRVNFSHKEMDINIMGFDDLLMDIDKIWAIMEPFYADIPIVTELPAWPSQLDNTTCSLCLTVITSGRIIHNGNNYHSTCANLWLNYVNNNLPVLRYPSNV